MDPKIFQEKVKNFNSKTTKEKELEILQQANWDRCMESGQAGSDTPSLEHYIKEIKKKYREDGFEI